MTIFDLYTEQGSTFRQDLSLGQDLTGYTILGELKDSNGAYLSGIISFTDIATGAVRFNITSGQTASLSAGVGHYNVELTETATGYVTKPLSGRVYIKSEVTQ